MPPLTGLKVQQTYVESSVLVGDVRLSVNLVSLTIDQVLSKRKQMVINMLDNLMLEMRSFVRGWAAEETVLMKMLGLKPVMDRVKQELERIRIMDVGAFN